MAGGKSVAIRKAEIAEVLRIRQSEVSRELAALTQLEDDVADAIMDDGRWLSAQGDRMEDAELEDVRACCEPRHDDPVTVYARAVFTAGRTRVFFVREHAIATKVPGHVREVPGWPAVMRADGLPDRVVLACRRLLRNGALSR